MAWYENLRKKYPNGVLCYVWNYPPKIDLGGGQWGEQWVDIILDYYHCTPRPFIGINRNYYWAKPIPKEKAPAIIR